MKALSLLQPWASLVAVGAKRFETRSFPTGYRGVIAIHASRSKPSRRIKFDPATALEIDAVLGHDWDALPLGKIIAVTRIVGCQPTPGPAEAATEYEFGDYGLDRFVWSLEKPILVLDPPIPARGMLGIWETPWPVTSAVILQRDPLCTEATCGNHSEHADHTVARTLGGLDSWENCKGKCAVCHGRKTAAERRGDVFQYLE